MRYLVPGFLLLFALFSSCKKEEIQGLDKQLQKEWILQTDDESSSITLTENNGERNWKGTVPFLEDTTGTWAIDEEDSTLTFWSNAKLRTADVDSTVLVGNGPGSKIILFQNGKEVGYILNDEVHSQLLEQTFTIQHLEDRKLTILGQSASIELEVQTKELGGDVTFAKILRGLLGMVVLVFIAFLFSTNRKAVNWSLVGKGLAIQLIFALLILKVPFVEMIFEEISNFFIVVIDFGREGITFLFRQFGTNEVAGPLMNFAIWILPTIIFFSALTSLFYYWGILQKIVYVFAAIMKRIMRLSGAESMAAAGNIFLGQTESPLLIKPYLDRMTKSEIMCLMSGGMATIAGAVLASYIVFLGGDDPEQKIFFAKHLLAASVMSAPAAIVASKILVPETEEFDSKLEVPKDKLGTNALESISNGTSEGLKLAVNVGAMLLVFTALVAMGNFILGDMIGEWTGLNQLIADNTTYDGLSFQFILGYTLAPIAWILGVNADDMFLVGQLLGEKTILNEFYAYKTLGDMKNTGEFMHDRSILMSTYILCGFANFASIGIQIGGIGSLAPQRKGLLSQLGFRALIAGTLACLFTAVIVGMLN